MRSATSGTIPGAPGAFRLPSTDAERWVAALWQDVLGVHRVGANDDFFALGGDSLSASRVMSRIRAAFGVELPVATLFAEPTLAAQAGRLVSARIAGSDPSLVRSLLEEEGLSEVAE
jgi:acyl carrier protein